VLVFGVFFLQTKFMIENVLSSECFCVIFGFGLGHSVVGHQAHDLSQDRGAAVQLVISVESVTVERIGSGWGFILGRILGDLVSRDLVIGLLKH
jgi:hypothetical protein